MNIRLWFIVLNYVLTVFYALLLALRVYADLVGYATLPDDQKVANSLLSKILDFVLSADTTVLVLACLLGSFFSFYAVLKLKRLNIDFSYFDIHETLRKFVSNRDAFTLVEAACLLAGQEIVLNEPTGPAAGYLETLKAKIADGTLSPKKKRSKTEELVLRQRSKMLTHGLGLPDPVKNSMEVKKTELAVLAKELDISIPGL